LLAVGTPYDALGLYNEGLLYLDTSANGVWDGVAGGDTFRDFGIGAIASVAKPVIGDWDGDHVDDLGLFDDGYFYLDMTGNGVWDGVSGGDMFRDFGIGPIASVAKPVIGDWDGDADHPPTSDDSTITTDENTRYVFRRDDFPFVDVDGDRFYSVRIDSTPDQGELLLKDQPVADGQIVGWWEFRYSNLTYLPDSGEFGTPYSVLEFSVGTDYAFGERLSTPIFTESHSMTINVNEVDAEIEYFPAMVDSLGNPISTVGVGESFFVEVYGRDLLSRGIYAGYMDIVYDSTRAMLVGDPIFADDFDWFITYDASTEGRIDNIGAANEGTDKPAPDPTRKLFTLEFLAAAPGIVELRAEMPEAGSLFHTVVVGDYGDDFEVELARIDFLSTTIEVVQDAGQDASTSGSGDEFTVQATDATAVEPNCILYQELESLDTAKFRINGSEGSDPSALTIILDDDFASNSADFDEYSGGDYDIELHDWVNGLERELVRDEDWEIIDDDPNDGEYEIKIYNWEEVSLPLDIIVVPLEDGDESEGDEYVRLVIRWDETQDDDADVTIEDPVETIIIEKAQDGAEEDRVEGRFTIRGEYEEGSGSGSPKLSRPFHVLIDTNESRPILNPVLNPATPGGDYVSADPAELQHLWAYADQFSQVIELEYDVDDVYRSTEEIVPPEGIDQLTLAFRPVEDTIDEGREETVRA